MRQNMRGYSTSLSHGSTVEKTYLYTMDIQPAQLRIEITEINGQLTNTDIDQSTLYKIKY